MVKLSRATVTTLGGIALSGASLFGGSGCASMRPAELGEAHQRLTEQDFAPPKENEHLRTIIETTQSVGNTPFPALLPQPVSYLLDFHRQQNPERTRAVFEEVSNSSLSPLYQAAVLTAHLQSPITITLKDVSTLCGNGDLSHLTPLELLLVLEVGSELYYSDTRLALFSAAHSPEEFDTALRERDTSGGTLLENLSAILHSEHIDPVFLPQRRQAVEELLEFALALKVIDQGDNGTCTAGALLLALNNESEMARLCRQLFSPEMVAVYANGDLLRAVPDAVERPKRYDGREVGQRVLQSALMEDQNGLFVNYYNRTDSNIGFLAVPGALPHQMARVYSKLTDTKHHARAWFEFDRQDLIQFSEELGRVPATIYPGGWRGHAICIIRADEERVHFLDPNGKAYVENGKVEERWNYDNCRVEDADSGHFSVPTQEFMKRLTHVIVPSRGA